MAGSADQLSSHVTSYKVMIPGSRCPKLIATKRGPLLPTSKDEFLLSPRPTQSNVDPGDARDSRDVRRTMSWADYPPDPEERHDC